MATQMVDSVRDLIEGDLAAYPVRTGSFGERDWNVFSEVVGSAFQAAVQRRFPDGADSGAVATLIAAAREPYADTALDVDEESASALVRSALGDDSSVAPVLERYDEPDLARIELLLLRRLLADAGLAGPGLVGFLAESGAAARPWSGEPATEDAALDGEPV
jgi:hypothetical protein